MTRIDRRLCLLLLTLFLIPTTLATATLRAADKPNVIIIYVDDK